MIVLGSVFLLYPRGHLNGLFRYLAVALPIVLGFMGVLLALHEDWAKRHRGFVIVAFVVIGSLAFYTAKQQLDQSTKEAAEAQSRLDTSNTRLSESLDRLGTQSNEISRVQDLNTKLQNRLLDQSGQLIDSSKQITGLSKTAITTSTGGDSFCYMVFSGPLVPCFVHVGEHPLYTLNVTTTDLTKSDNLFNPTDLPSMPVMYQIHVGDLSPGSSHCAYDHLIEWGSGHPQRQDFRVFFEARNGFWHEDLQFRAVAGTWHKALRVFRHVGKKRTLVLTLIDKEFPTQRPDWHK